MGIENPQGQTTGSFAAAGTAAPATSAAAAPTAAGQQTPHSDRPASLLRMGRVGGIVRSAAGEALTKGMTAVKDVIAEMRISSAYKVSGVQIDNQQETGLRLSSIVLVLLHQPSGTVSHHTLLLEASSDPIAATQAQAPNGTPILIDRFASQVYDSVYAATVEKTVASMFQSAKIRNTGATVVPRIFNWEDKDAVRALVGNAAIACATYIEATIPGFVDMDMTKVKDPNEQLAVAIAWDNGQTQDFVGLPVRSDIMVTTTVQSTQRQDSGSLNNQQEQETVARVTAYMDLAWAPAQNQMMAYAVPTPGMSRKYRPRLIITRLENAMRLTPAAQLFGIASALCLTESNNWIRAFQPRRNVPAGTKDPRDIGAINIEANLQNEATGFGKPIDTKTATFGDRDLGALVFAALHPELAISIDVSDAGADTWYNRVFAQAAAGNPDANKEILFAANTLTGGAFGKLYGTNNSFPAMLMTDERVLMGYYIDRDGQRQDVRNLDYLAVMNLLGRENPQAIIDYSQTIEAVDQPQALRLQGRKAIFRNMADNIVYTQVATRATFHPEFLKMLVQAMQACGANFKLVAGQLGDYTSQRAGGTFNQAAFGMGGTSLFTAGFGNAPGMQGGQYRPFQPGSIF